jgi:transposase
VFQLHGVDRHGKVVWKRRLKRDQWLKAVLDRGQPGCEIGMEACGSSHHWARELQSRGYTVKLIAPQFVKPYVKSNKNDANDAEAICEAMSRPNMRFVTVKSIDQQDIQATHRIRSGLMTQRTAKANQIRGLATGLQPCPSAQRARLSDPNGGCSTARNDQQSIITLALGVCPLRGKGQGDVRLPSKDRSQRNDQRLPY